MKKNVVTFFLKNVGATHFLKILLNEMSVYYFFEKCSPDFS
jgi:hypothetical protein